jgi:hypothetical protein
VAEASGQQTALLWCELVEWVDREWPGWVKARLVDVVGRTHYFVDKVPVFGGDFGPEEQLPAPGLIRCEVISRAGTDGDPIVLVSTSVDHVTSVDGMAEFRVHPDQLADTAG